MGAAAPASASGREGHGRGRRPFRVHIVMFDGVEEQDWAGPYEVFSAAKPHSGGRAMDVSLVTAGPTGAVRCSYGAEVQVSRRWAPHEAELIVVPGGGYARRNGPGIWAEIERGTLPRALAAAPRRGLTLSSLCTGALLLSAAGLVKGRRCTTHRGALKDLERGGGVLTPARVVDDGDLVTAQGITSGLELGLWLVKRELSSEAANSVEMMLEYAARGTVWETGRRS
ncbi:DJ-1/PfpI family protein [Streptomyces sp. SB3404]|uniref:DJ-1/PfpI family protein n=1 Tax=Streptomyces boncukensis TaxID=2711219 RepID=A0A6G4WZA2_9ACTN|nr:DJ-1/PfpI family protein [Streptomyces boncukensis]